MSGRRVSDSISSRRLYLARRSDWAIEPTLIWSPDQPTDRSASQWSSVSPLRAEMVTCQLALRASLRASAASAEAGLKRERQRGHLEGERYALKALRGDAIRPVNVSPLCCPSPCGGSMPVALFIVGSFWLAAAITIWFGSRVVVFSPRTGQPAMYEFLDTDYSF